MSLPVEVVEASYGWCRGMARRSGSSFYLSFLGLPRAKRRAMDALYAFMRHTDDLADDPQPLDWRREALTRWRAVLQGALKGRFDLAEHRPPPFKGQEPPGRRIRRGGCANAIPAGRPIPCRNLLPALVDVVHRFAVPPEHLWAVIDGVEMDLGRRRYETFDQLRGYCEQVASAVGLACIHVWGFDGQEALQPARESGIALQLTNILRDLKEDAHRDRVYLPLEELQRFDYSVDELKRGTVNPRFGRLMEFQIERAERFYRQGAELIEWLQAEGRRTFGMMMATYRAVLEQIKRRPADVLRRRVCLSRATKLRIAARWILLPPPLKAEGLSEKRVVSVPSPSGRGLG